MTEQEVIQGLMNVGTFKVQHYKGETYTVAGLACFSEDITKRLVLYTNGKSGKWFARPLTKEDRLFPNDATFCGVVNNSTTERFVLL